LSLCLFQFFTTFFGLLEIISLSKSTSSIIFPLVFFEGERGEV
jgi:hypothetical protein